MIVLKFGGNTLASPEKIKVRARQIAEYHKQGEKIIVVVSAMGKTTDELKELAYKVSPKPLSRELDMLLTAGERISMSLLSIALNDLNCPAISFTGSQAGILTEADHNNAEIKEVKPIRVEQEINNNKVVIIAGFQGVDPNTKEVTTLGRGGSDTTAIFMAEYFNADTCKMLKETAGVFTADPKLVPDAKPITQLNFEQMYHMALGGACVVHSKAIARARLTQRNFEVCSAEDHKLGTVVTNESAHSSGPIALNLNTDNYLTLTFAKELSPSEQETWVKKLQSETSVQNEPKVSGLNISFQINHKKIDELMMSLHNKLQIGGA